VFVPTTSGAAPDLPRSARRHRSRAAARPSGGGAVAAAASCARPCVRVGAASAATCVLSCLVLSCTVVTAGNVTGNGSITVGSVTRNGTVTADSVTPSPFDACRCRFCRSAFVGSTCVRLQSSTSYPSPSARGVNIPTRTKCSMAALHASTVEPHKCASCAGFAASAVR
jgi:hypothetical protein